MILLNYSNNKLKNLTLREFFMNEQYLYFICLKGNKDILKKEISLNFPDFTPSFSQKEFLTYKNKGQKLNVEDIKRLEIAFALDWGESIGKLEKEFIEKKLKFQVSSFELPDEAPSRAYLKIAETCEALNIHSDSKINWIEFGSAPGGASLYLLNHFGSIYGVDPAKMKNICLEHKNYTHSSKPIQNLSQEELPEDVDYIASDLNVNPKQGIKEVIRLSKKYKNNLKGVFYTFKLIKMEHLKILAEYKEMMEGMGYSKVFFKQLPSHKRETLLIALR